MARPTRTGRPYGRHLLFFLLCLLLVAAGCSNDDSVFSTQPDGTPNTQGTTIPGGTGNPGTTGGSSDPGAQGQGNDPGDSAEAIPAGAQMYLGLDLTAMPTLMRMVEAFGAADPTALGEGLGEGLGLGEEAGEAAEQLGEAQDLATCMADALDLDPAALPAWVGAEAAMAMFDMEFDAVSGDVTDPSILMAVSVADQGAAASYLEQVVASVEDCAGTALEPVDHGGVQVYQAAGGEGEPPTSIALDEGYMLFGMGAGMVEAALDLADGASLADDPNFNEVLAALPASRHVTGYMGMGLPQQMLESLSTMMEETDGIPLPAGLNPAEALAGARGLGMSATMLTEGIRVDMVGVGESAQPLPAAGGAASPMPGLLPEDAFGFMGIGSFDVTAAWGSLMELLAQMPVEEGQPSVQETIDLLGFMLGIDIETDLIAQLTGEVGVGLLPATAGSLVEGSGVNLGLIAVMGVKDPGAMTATVEAMAQGLGQMAGAPASPRPFDGGTLYALSDGTTDMLLFGMAGDDMVLTTHESHAGALLGGGGKLTGSARYNEAISGLPSGSVPLMYLDIAALVSAMELEESEAAAVAPLQTIAMSVSMEGQVGGATIYARIDY